MQDLIKELRETKKDILLSPVLSLLNKEIMKSFPWYIMYTQYQNGQEMLQQV